MKDVYIIGENYSSDELCCRYFVAHFKAVVKKSFEFLLYICANPSVALTSERALCALTDSTPLLAARSCSLYEYPVLSS